jgi:hypothetical protein
MSLKRSAVILVTVMLMLGSTLATAQSTTIEIKRGTALHVYGNNLVVKMSDGTVQEFDVPEDFRFNIDGKQVAVGDLEPGTILTSAVKSTEVPREVKVTEIREGTVVKVVGTTLIVRMADGEIRRLKNVPRDQTFEVDGRDLRVEQLREGMNLRAKVVSTHVAVVTEQDVMVAGSAPVEEMKPVAAPEPRKMAAAAPTLPKTGSALPLAGLTGVALLMVGIGIAMIRRF